MPYHTFLSITLHQFPDVRKPFFRSTKKGNVLNGAENPKKLINKYLPVEPVVRVPRIRVRIVAAEIVTRSRVLKIEKIFMT